MNLRRTAELRRRLRLASQHPVWAVDVALARFREHLAPRSGCQRGTVGRIQFDFDFALDPAVRKMYVGAYEVEVADLFRKLLRPNDVCVDVGANIGYLSALAAGRVGPGGRVLSFEPAPRYFTRLDAVRRLNPCFQWDIYATGLGAVSGQADLALSATNMGWNSIIPGHIPAALRADTVTVPVRRLDDCLKEAGIQRVRLLKIDVEGYEGPVLLGASAYLQERLIDHLVVEIQPGNWETLGLKFDEILGFLSGCGYVAYQTRPPYRRAQPHDFVHCADIWFRRC